MKSGLRKIVLGMVTCMAVLMIFSVRAKADTGNVSISSASGTKGDTVTVSVTASADVDAVGQIGISYDTNYLEYVSDGTNGGVAGLILSVLDMKAGQAQTINLNFVLKEAGSTTLSVASNTQILAVNSADPENAEMNYNSSNGTVTINAATTASNDSHLSGLIISAVAQGGETTNVGFTPAFSPDVYEYTADLASNITRIIVATTLSDSKATTQVSGTKIDVGNNRTIITVTAEDGTQSVYTIYSVRASENATQPPTETTTEGPTDESQTQPEESSTELDRTPKLVEALGKYIIQDFSIVAIPEGFEEGIAVYGGQNIAVLKGIAKKLTLVCLADDAQGTNIQLYIYNEASGAINKMVDITSTQKIYTILPTDDSYQGPEGYTQTALEINGDIVKAWVKQEDSDFYVVYAMNWDGEEALYVYDKKEQTIQKFVEGNKSENFVDEPESENTEYLSMKRQYDELKKDYDNMDKKINKKNKMIVILITVLVIGIIIVAFVIYKLTSDNKNDFYLKDDDNDDDEIGSEHEQTIGSNISVQNPVKPNIENPVKTENTIMTESAVRPESTTGQESALRTESTTGQESALRTESTTGQESALRTESTTGQESTVRTESTIRPENPVKYEDTVKTENSAKSAFDKPAVNSGDSFFFTEEKNDSASENRYTSSVSLNNGTASTNVKTDKDEGILINMEDEAAFEIEFVDLDDKK